LYIFSIETSASSAAHFSNLTHFRLLAAAYRNEANPPQGQAANPPDIPVINFSDTEDEVMEEYTTDGYEDDNVEEISEDAQVMHHKIPNRQ
jgi:hypothetical protein